MGSFFKSASERLNPQPILQIQTKPGLVHGQNNLNTLSSQAVAQPTTNQVLSDSFAPVQSVSKHMASALQSQPNLMIQDAQGQQTAAEHYLNPQELQLLQEIPELFRRRILSIKSSQPIPQARQEIKQNIQELIKQWSQSDQIRFQAQGGREWELSSLLSLANAVHRLPIAQRKQLDGITFTRAASVALPEAMNPKLLDKMASQSIAGHYDLGQRAVILYDRGISDEMPVMGSDIKSSLRTVQSKGRSEEIRQVQKMLNPYLVSMQQPQLQPDGAWGPKTAQAVRTVQIELLNRHAQQHDLNPQQKLELEQLSLLARSPQFDMISRMTDIRSRMENLHLLPDPHMKQLLNEFANSDFGEASLSFLLQDISSEFRSNPQVSRAEEVLIHEMGHFFQLGLKNESYYISEFGKLSNWRETADGSRADGYINGVYAGEDLMDMYNVMASKGALDQGHYRAELSAEERSQKFVSNYAATDPMEDFAESYKAYILNPASLMQASPAKFFFINALPAIQARKMGSGAREASHYSPPEIEGFARQVLQARYQANPTQEHIKAFIREEFESIMGLNPNKKPMYLNPEAVLGIVETHRRLLERADMPYVPTERIYQQGDPDFQVFRQLHEHNRELIVSGGKSSAANSFFTNFKKPANIDKLFPDASPELRSKLKDPAFSAMMLALGEIGGHAYYLNQLRNEDLQDKRTYQEARNFFNRVLEQPSAALSTQTFSHSWNYLRGLGSEVFNPEDRKVSKTLQFFNQLQQNPAEAFPELWQKFPGDFQTLLQNQRFVQAISGDQGRYLPDPKATRATLEKVMEVLEFERSMDALLGSGD